MPQREQAEQSVCKKPIAAGGDRSRYAFILIGEKIMLAQGMSYNLGCILCCEAQCLTVLSISSKSGSKNGTHCWVPEVSSITAISYAPSQLFEHFIGRQLNSVPFPRAQTLLQVKQFALIAANSFHCTLENKPWRIMESKNLLISISDTNHFDKFTRHIHNIKSTIKNMNSKPRNGKELDCDDSDSGSEGDKEGKELFTLFRLCLSAGTIVLLNYSLFHVSLFRGNNLANDLSVGNKLVAQLSSLFILFLVVF
jgi:hypothetical protein